MEINQRSSYETRLVNLLQNGTSAEVVESLRSDFIVEKIREVRNSYDAVLAEYRLDGRDFLDLLHDEYADEVSITKVDDNQVRSYSANDFYLIVIGNLQLMFEMNLRTGEECHTAELYYGQSYAFSAVFLSPERLLEIIDRVASSYDSWMKAWKRILAKARKAAAVKQLSETAIVAYLRARLRGTGIQYYLHDRKEQMEVYFKLEWGLKFKVVLTRDAYRQQIDDAISSVTSLLSDMSQANAVGVHKSASSADVWLVEES